LAKLFLDTKSVFYDTTTFLYYVLYVEDTTSDDPTPRPIGFFSKEKLSWDSNNLACICIFPPWQKKGFGQILMGVSYELSKWDGRLGGPEKRKYPSYVPSVVCWTITHIFAALSELGRRAYLNFWSATIARHVAQLPTTELITVKSISEATFILPEDVIATVKDMDVVSRSASGHAIINKSAVATWMANNGVDMAGPVDETAFIDQPRISQNGD
jgi:hypothetical protein